MSRSYKFVFLGLYAINILFFLIALVIHWCVLDAPTVQDFCLRGMWCMGIWMVLSLWSRSYIVNDNYKGPRCLDWTTTRLLSAALFLIECMTIYATFYNDSFFKPATFCLAFWLVAFAYVSFSGKLIKRHTMVP